MGVSKQRIDYIDQFRGFIGIMMILGHSSYYLNSVWKQLDPFDPIFPTWGQFAVRYAGYICAPGFLMMAGAMVFLSFHRQVSGGLRPIKSKWYFLQRGLFLILIQMTWVNSAWGGFSALNPWHFGIISTIGMSVILLIPLVQTRWYMRAGIALLILLIHPLLLTIPYNPESILHTVLMETFITAGDFNKYPVLPWFALALLGSVMAHFWFTQWDTFIKKILWGFSIAAIAILLAIGVRIINGYGTILPFSDFGSISFFVDQKYPPSLFHNLLFFGFVVTGVTCFVILNKYLPRFAGIFSIPGKVPLFFYCIHLAILGIFVKRLNFYYLEGGIWLTFIGFFVLLAIMLPLAGWFFRVKLRSNNYFIRMI